MAKSFRKIFEPEPDSNGDREKFLSRTFGIFAEKIVSIWASHEHSRYHDLGRPTLKTQADSRGHTLDFTLREKSSGKTFVCEMKCEIEFQNFKYFVLERASQLDHHKKPAFCAFLRAADPTADQNVFVRGKKIDVDGAILVWGAVTAEGRADVMNAKGLHDVMSVEEMCADLVAWGSVEYSGFVKQRQNWSNELFSGLLEATAD